MVGVLVLGAWTCAPPSGGGDDVAGMSTAGYAAVAAGEDWHYVGEAGEPAFDGSWGNLGATSTLGFRIREAGVVDVQGTISNAGANSSGSVVFTLPDGYRPSVATRYPVTVLTDDPAVAAGLMTVSTAGVVGINTLGMTASIKEAYVSGQFFLVPPD